MNLKLQKYTIRYNKRLQNQSCWPTQNLITYLFFLTEALVMPATKKPKTGSWYRLQYWRMHGWMNKIMRWKKVNLKRNVVVKQRQNHSKKSKDEKTITTLMCSSALIDTQLFHMTLFPWMWETHSSHFREILISCFIVCLAEDKAMDDLKLTKEEKGRNLTVCLYRQRFALFSQRAQQMLWLSYLSHEIKVIVHGFHFLVLITLTS